MEKTVTRYGPAFISLGLISLLSIGGEGHGSARVKPVADQARAARIAYLKEHALPVRSIDAEDIDFADLEPLREVIGGRRVVMLGESTHGDGATFAAKCRLIRFLHERMGFDALAFESGFYDTRKGWSALRAGEDPLKAVSSGIDPIWSSSRQIQPLWRYLAAQSKTDHPLELCGFDSQFTGDASDKYLLKDLGGYLTKIEIAPPAAGAASRVTAALALVLNEPNFLRNGSPFKKIQPAEQDSILSAFRALGAALRSLRPSDESESFERDYWVQFLKSGAAFLEQSWLIDLESRDLAAFNKVFNLRDRQMGDNFDWLAKRAYPARKIIVWAATSHVIRRRSLLAKFNDPLVAMGDWINEAMGAEVYALGFTAYKGRWGDVGMALSTEVIPPEPNSLEALLFSAGFEYALVDFRNPAAAGAWLREPLSCSFLRSKPMSTDWSRVVDGMFFIKEMFPSARIEENFLKDE